MATSQNGWPALTSGSKLLFDWTVPGADTKLMLRNGSAGFVLVHWATIFNQNLEVLKEKVLDDWGYSYRPIRGYDSGLSNHAAGCAEDLNATDHPLGKTGTFSHDEVAKIHHVVAKLYTPAGGGLPVIRWGGDYMNRKDEMHWEINRDMKAVESVARRLMKSQRGVLILNANPSQKKVIMS